MSNRLTNPNIQFLDNSGRVLSGGLLYTYVTSTSTPATTYTDRDLNPITHAQTNPIVLDGAGRAGEVFLDPAVTYKLILKTAAGVTLWTKDPVVDLAANITASVQIYNGNPNTHIAGNAGTVGSTGASLVYDTSTGTLYVCTTTGNAAAAVWTAISNAITGNEDIYTADHTLDATNLGRVATANKASAITFSLTAAATIGAGKLQAVKNIGVGALTLDPNAAELIEGLATLVLTTNQGALLYCTGSGWRVLAFHDGLLDTLGRTSFPAEVTVASATTCNILGAASEAVAISGTVTVTSFGTGPNRRRHCRATGAFLITHNATTLICPGAASITTAAGDTWEVISDASSNARIVNYQRASGVPISASAAGTGLTGYLFGLTFSNNSTTAIDLAIGSARDSTDVDMLVLSGALTNKILGTAWAVGSSAGMLDTGVVANAWYYIFLIKRVDTGVVDVLASLSATAPTMPANYTLKRRIGAILRTGGSIKSFSQVDDHFIWAVPPQDVSISNPGTSACTASLTIPIVQVDADFWATFIDETPAADTYVLLTSPSQIDGVPSATLLSLALIDGAISGDRIGASTLARIGTTNGTIRYRLSASSPDHEVLINTNGWWDTRGRFK